jgi:deoxynucleoside triphosphate triphosphohydrolase SAMHD1
MKCECLYPMSKRRRFLSNSDAPVLPTTIFDPVHREYELSAEIIDIINTTVFQRLRRLKQLATAHWVWLGATHTRFEHSISVSYLAGHLATSLQRKQPELGISDRQILLVQLAGLLHDVGHGPFSHLFDDIFLAESTSPMAHHEQRSVAIVTQLLTESTFSYTAEEIAFVQSLIAPSKGQEGFLYHIVANQVNHLDVDKMEYIKRDARACGLSSGGFDTDTMRIINAARVIDGHICYHKKVYEDIYNLFQTRYRLHTTVYRHSAVVAIHHMVADALRASNIPLEKSIEKLTTFYTFDDGVLDTLRYDDTPAGAIVRRIDQRNLYKVAVTEKNTKLWETMPTAAALAIEGLTAEDIIVDFSCVGFTGKADGHPMDSIRFYDNARPTKSFVMTRRSVSTLLTPRYCEYWTRVIVKDDKHLALAQKAWKEWQSSI